MSPAPSGRRRQVEQALAVRGHERGDEDQRRDPLGAVRRRLGDDDAAHAVADEDGRLRPLGQHRADAVGAALERDLLDRRLVRRRRRGGRASRPCGRRLERVDDRLPASRRRRRRRGRGRSGPSRAITRLERQHELALRAARSRRARARARPPRAGTSRSTCGRSAPVAASSAIASIPGRSGSTRMPVTRTRSPAASRSASRPAPDGTEMKHPAVAQRRRARRRRLAADEVEHDVDVADAILDGLARVVDRLVGAEPGQERVLGRARRPDHVGAARLRDLHRQVPDAARGARGPARAALPRRRRSRRAPARPSARRAAAPPPRRRRAPSGIRASWRDGEVTYSA